MTRRSIIASTAGIITTAATLAGCGGGKQQAQPLSSQQFFSPVVEQTPQSSIEQPGPIENNNVAIDLMQPLERERQAQRLSSDRSVRNVSPVVRQATEPAAASATDPASTQPTTQPVTMANGGFLTIGGVIAEVNGEPVFADQILREVEPELASKARILAEPQFRIVAQQEIQQQVGRAVNDELVFAAAERALDQRERDLADAMTAKWRQDRITEAGGSLEVARKRAQEQGTTFEEMVREKYRGHMAQVYYQKKIIPRIQVTAEDLRRYYQRNVDKEFTEHAQARFRLIKIEVKKIGTRDEAIQRARETRERALVEDFGELASSVNHDEMLRKSAGDVGFIDKGSFRLDDVEKAVWNLEPNGVSDIIDAGDAFYIAKLEQKRDGRVRAFEEPAVQAAIRSKLWSEQFQSLREAEHFRLRQQSIISGVDNQGNFTGLQPAIEIAMQKYPQWAAEE